jgi:hypothetical protein
LEQLGVPLKWFGFVAAGMTLLQAAVLMKIDRVERLFGGKRAYLRMSSLIPGLALLGLAFAPSAWLAAPMMILISGFGLSRSTIISNYLHKHVDSARRATVVSSVGMTRQLFTAAVYPLVGWAAEKSLTWTFAALGAALLACAAASSVEEAHLLD